MRLSPATLETLEQQHICKPQRLHTTPGQRLLLPQYWLAAHLMEGDDIKSRSMDASNNWLSYAQKVA